MLDAPSLPHNLYNLTAGVWLTFGEILAQLKELAPSAEVIEVEPTGDQSNLWGGGSFRGPLSGHRLFQDLRWTPKFDLKAGLEDYLQWRRDSSYSG